MNYLLRYTKLYTNLGANVGT